MPGEHTLELAKPRGESRAAFSLGRLRGVLMPESQVWVLAHPESRHLPHVAAVYAHLSQRLSGDFASGDGAR